LFLFSPSKYRSSVCRKKEMKMIKISPITSMTILMLVAIPIFSSVPVGYAQVTGKAVGTTGLVDSSNFGSFSSACSAATSAHVALYVSKAWNELATQTCAAPLVAQTNGTIVPIRPAHGQTVRLSGGILNSGLSQICDTSAGGSCVINGMREIHPQWFGAKGDGVTDDTAAIQAAANASQAAAATLYFPAGTYVISSTITLTQTSAICEDAFGTKFIANGSFTAFKFIATRKRFENFNVWFRPPVTSEAIGYQFGDRSQQFARNVVENFYVRYAYMGYFASSDMWGNSFTQINSDFSLLYGYQFTANPSGTTNSFRNIYATNASTTGSISSGSSTLTVADATNLSAGLPLVILGAGASGPLLTTISKVSGSTVVLANAASTTVSSTVVMLRGTAWYSRNFSDTHFYNAYFDHYPSSANRLSGSVYTADSNFDADSIRFESCALVASNTALVNDASSSSNISKLMSFVTSVDIGNGNYGFIYKSGTGKYTQHSISEIELENFSWYSGGLKKLNISSNDNLTFNGHSASFTDSDSSGYEGNLFFGGSRNLAIANAPTNGSWDLGESYGLSNSRSVSDSGGVCTTRGTFGTLTGINATTIRGENFIVVDSLSSLQRNEFITIAGVSGSFKVVDMNKYPSPSLLVVPAPNASVSNASISYAKPTFNKIRHNSVGTNRGNNDVTLIAGTDAQTQLFGTPLTSNHTVTLSTTGAQVGDKFRVVRLSTATGAFALTVGGKALGVSAWIDVEYTGSNWSVTAYGSL
jgi:hypothetical protein